MENIRFVITHGLDRRRDFLDAQAPAPRAARAVRRTRNHWDLARFGGVSMDDPLDQPYVTGELSQNTHE
jgi:hypothetical protein